VTFSLSFERHIDAMGRRSTLSINYEDMNENIIETILDRLQSPSAHPEDVENYKTVN